MSLLFNKESSPIQVNGYSSVEFLEGEKKFGVGEIILYDPQTHNELGRISSEALSRAKQYGMKFDVHSISSSKGIYREDELNFSSGNMFVYKKNTTSAAVIGFVKDVVDVYIPTHYLHSTKVSTYSVTPRDYRIQYPYTITTKTVITSTVLVEGEVFPFVPFVNHTSVATIRKWYEEDCILWLEKEIEFLKDLTVEVQKSTLERNDVSECEYLRNKLKRRRKKEPPQLLHDFMN